MNKWEKNLTLIYLLWTPLGHRADHIQTGNIQNHQVVSQQSGQPTKIPPRALEVPRNP